MDPIFRSHRRRGFSLFEVLIASFIMVLSSAVAMAAFTYTLRSNKAQRTQIIIAKDVQVLQSTLKQHATSARQFILNGGTTLRIQQPDDSETGAAGVISQLSIEDDDNNPATAFDNRLVLTPNLDEPDETRVILSGLARLGDPANPGTFFPYFTQPAGAASLRVRFRLGDQARNQGGSADNAHTGMGYQTFVFDSTFMARNNG